MSFRLPVIRGECAAIPRPCPFVSCRYHLLPVVKDADDIRVLRESCVLDVAEEGGLSIVKVGQLLHLNQMMVWKIEQRALRKLRAFATEAGR